MPLNLDTPSGLEILGSDYPGIEKILTKECLSLVAELEKEFRKERLEVLQERSGKQVDLDGGALPDFLEETRAIRESDWKITSIPHDLLDRRVEITGPVDRKMIINALNSDAKTFMTDFEDSMSPTWGNIIQGQINLRDLWNNEIDFADTKTGKEYKLNPNPSVLIVRPRGWHLEEAHIEIDKKRISGGIFDFAVYLFHNHKNIKEKNTGPYFYLPKMESYLEARLWNKVFTKAQEILNIPIGTCKATVLIETLPAAFQMDEILYGLNCGRWDYIFIYIKRLGNNPDYILPDRSQVVMGDAFLNAYSLLLIKTCHKRGAFAMGGMAAQIPVKNDDAKNNAAFEKVKKDKEREAKNGHDGTWVAHPGLVPIALDVFNSSIVGDNQLEVSLETINISQKDLLKVHDGERTEDGMRECIRVGIQYIAAWLGGRGAVPLYNLMEDAATAEISRAQIWQWLKHSTTLKDGRIVTIELFKSILKDEINELKKIIGENQWNQGKFEKAIELFEKMSISPDCKEFLTLSAYEEIISLKR
jgi:malate synthase